MKTTTSSLTRIVSVVAVTAILLSGCARAAKADVKAFKDIDYYTGEGYNPEKHKLDVHVPGDGGNGDVVIWIHGGAWVIGDRTQYAYVGRAFAAKGLITVVVSYRLTPEVQHPGHIRDVAAAFAWVHKHIAEYGGNPKRIFVCGQSAGGHLTSLLVMNGKYLKEHGLDSSAVAGFIPVSGVYDVSSERIEHAARLGHSTDKIFTPDAELKKDASPILHVRPGLPPMLILVAEKDPLMLRVQAARLRDELVKAGYSPGYVELKGEDHVSEIFHIGKKWDPITPQVVEFVKNTGE